MPYDEVEERFPKEFDRTDDIIVYCLKESCQASPAAAATLEEMGFENVRETRRASSDGRSGSRRHERNVITTRQ